MNPPELELTETEAEEPGPELAIDAERCAHQRVRHAGCRACVDCCPTGAWQMDDEGLGLDTDLCDLCGLCVAACPTEALELPSPQPLLKAADDGGFVAWWRCERTGEPDEGTIPCLLALSPAWLHLTARTLDIREYRLAHGPCHECERGTSLAEWQRQYLGQRMLAAGQGFMLRITQACAQDWPDANRGELANTSRRRFFARAAQLVRPQFTGQLHSARERVRLQISPASASRKVRLPGLWYQAFEQDKCSLCLACIRICPTRAIFFSEDGQDPSQGRFGFEPLDCTGCGLCSDICEDAALSAPKPTPFISSQAGQKPHYPLASFKRDWPVKKGRCARCGIDFLHFVGQGAQKMPVQCPTCRRGRPLRAERIVQTS